MVNQNQGVAGAPRDAHEQDEIMERQRQRGGEAQSETNPVDEAVAESFPASDPPAATSRATVKRHDAEKADPKPGAKTGG